MAQQRIPTVVIVLAAVGAVAVLVVIFLGGYFLVNSGASKPVEVAEAEQVNATAAAVTEPMPVPATVAVPPAPVKPTWTAFENNGCTTAIEGSKLHITGTTSQDGWDHWNGVQTQQYPEGDFTASVDFMVPKFTGAGTPLIYLRVSSENGQQLGIFFRPRGQGYRLQAWTTPQIFGPWQARLGDEETAFHKMRLRYDAANQQASGWIDDRPLGSIAAPLTGKVQFQLVANTEKAGMTVDLVYDNFEVMMGSKPKLP